MLQKEQKADRALLIVSELDLSKSSASSKPSRILAMLLQIINNDLNFIDIEDMDKIKSELEDLGKE